ncbi:MAG: DUF1707 SHOCT-like domain-containing protein [Stackebrandtia sp.]
MPAEPLGVDPKDQRAGDSDRQKVADRLRLALDEGRLDFAEYDDRLKQAYSSKTYRELEDLVSDIPRTVPESDSRLSRRVGTQVEQERHEDRRRRFFGGLQARWGGWLSMSVLLSGIWMITVVASGELQYFWPAWPIGIVGVCILAGWAQGQGRKS